MRLLFFLFVRLCKAAFPAASAALKIFDQRGESSFIPLDMVGRGPSIITSARRAVLRGKAIAMAGPMKALAAARVARAAVALRAPLGVRRCEGLPYGRFCGGLLESLRAVRGGLLEGLRARCV